MTIATLILWTVGGAVVLALAHQAIDAYEANQRGEAFSRFARGGLVNTEALRAAGIDPDDIADDIATDDVSLYAVGNEEETRG